MTTIRTPIVDKNGVATHRHKSIPSPKPQQSRAIPAPRRIGKTIYSVAQDIKRDNPGLILNIAQDSRTGVMRLGLISVSSDKRGSGIATNAMQRLVDEADANGWKMALSPSDDMGADKSRLVAFYMKFGFVPNKDPRIPETMVRNPMR